MSTFIVKTVLSKLFVSVTLVHITLKEPNIINLISVYIFRDLNKRERISRKLDRSNLLSRTVSSLCTNVICVLLLLRYTSTCATLSAAVLTSS